MLAYVYIIFCLQYKLSGFFFSFLLFGETVEIESRWNWKQVTRDPNKTRERTKGTDETSDDHKGGRSCEGTHRFSLSQGVLAIYLVVLICSMLGQCCAWPETRLALIRCWRICLTDSTCLLKQNSEQICFSLLQKRASTAHAFCSGSRSPASEKKASGWYQDRHFLQVTGAAAADTRALHKSGGGGGGVPPWSCPLIAKAPLDAFSLPTREPS